MSALAVNQVGINNFYLGFSKDQEREADYYAIETLNKLSLSSNSIIKLLQILESNAINRGIGEELQKFSIFARIICTSTRDLLSSQCFRVVLCVVDISINNPRECNEAIQQ